MHFFPFLQAELQSSISLCIQLCLHQVSYSVLPSTSVMWMAAKKVGICMYCFLFATCPSYHFCHLFHCSFFLICFLYVGVMLQPLRGVPASACIAHFQQCISNHVSSDFPFHVLPLPCLLHLTCPSATALFKHYLNLQFLWNMTEVKTEVSSCSEEDKANYLLQIFIWKRK